jgi:hypothetical protein
MIKLEEKNGLGDYEIVRWIMTLNFEQSYKGHVVWIFWRIKLLIQRICQIICWGVRGSIDRKKGLMYMDQESKDATSPHINFKIFKGQAKLEKHYDF